MHDVLGSVVQLLLTAGACQDFTRPEEDDDESEHYMRATLMRRLTASHYEVSVPLRSLTTHIRSPNTPPCKDTGRSMTQVCFRVFPVGRSGKDHVLQNYC